MTSVIAAHAERTIGFAPYAVPSSGTVVIAVGEAVPQAGVFAEVDAVADGALRRAVDASTFLGERDTQLSLPGVGPFDRVLLIGTGADTATNAYAYSGFFAIDKDGCGSHGERYLTFRSHYPWLLNQRWHVLTHPNTGATGPKRPYSTRLSRNTGPRSRSNWLAVARAYLPTLPKNSKST